MPLLPTNSSRHDRAVGRTDGKIEEEGYVFLGSRIRYSKAFLIIMGWFSMLFVGHRVLLDDSPDIAGMGEAIEIIEAESIRAIRHAGSDGSSSDLPFYPVHSEVPLADAGGVVALALEERGYSQRVFGMIGFEKSSERRIVRSAKDTCPSILHNGSACSWRRPMGVVKRMPWRANRSRLGVLKSEFSR